jgi:hypothetical protein
MAGHGDILENYRALQLTEIQNGLSFVAPTKLPGMLADYKGRVAEDANRTLENAILAVPLCLLALKPPDSISPAQWMAKLARVQYLVGKVAEECQDLVK